MVPSRGVVEWVGLEVGPHCSGGGGGDGGGGEVRPRGGVGPSAIKPGGEGRRGSTPGTTAAATEAVEDEGGGVGGRRLGLAVGGHAAQDGEAVQVRATLSSIRSADEDDWWRSAGGGMRSAPLGGWNARSRYWGAI